MRAVRVAVAALAAGLAPASAEVLVSLGDSVAWGYQPSNATTPSDGLRAWVPEVAQQIGATPINLAVPGETSESYFSGGRPGAGLNTNYAWPNPPTQADLFALTVASLDDEPVSAVTVSLGANDIIALTTDIGFFFATPEERAVLIEQVVSGVATNLANVLGQVDALAPDATVIVLNYYNPLNAFLANADPADDVLAALGDEAILALNGEIAAVAGAHGAHLADIYGAFLGREAELTHTLGGDVHPNDAGYGVIAAAVGAVIPAPGSAVVLGAMGLLASRRRRR